MQFRPYQSECLDIIDNLSPGSYIIRMATGLGKTVVFTNIRRRGRVLVLAHREELIYQPAKYYDCPVGIEMASERSFGQDVVIASVQSLVRRLDRFSPDTFDMIITDEAHHAGASTYRKILSYFRPRLHLGFTATPNRSDRMRLDDIFSDIVFDRDLLWGIRNGYLSDIYCRRVDIGYNLSKVTIRNGDYAPGELNEAMDGTADAIAEAYKKLATGATLIFAVSVRQAEEIAKRIPGAAVVTGETKNRAAIIDDFTRGEIPCIVNCMVFTEGTDIPRVETVIVARPTASDTLYTQMVGRGLRLYPGKEKLNLIDCVGVAGKVSLCTAPSLLGLDLSVIPEKRLSSLEGLLFELPEKAAIAADCPESWIRNVEIVDLWAKAQRYQTHNVNYFKMPNGDLVCKIPGKSIVIPAPDEIGNTTLGGTRYRMQDALDLAYKYLSEKHADKAYIWDLAQAKKWGKKPATEKQIALINRLLNGYKDADGLTKLQAGQIINRLTTKGA